MEYMSPRSRSSRRRRKTRVVPRVLLCLLLGFLVWYFFFPSACSDTDTPAPEPAPANQDTIVEDNLVSYPGRTFSYRAKFNDLQEKQLKAAQAIGLSRPPKDREDAASMRHKLVEVTTGTNYVVDDLTHSVPYLVPAAKRELDSIGAEWADILQRNGLPHYRFVVTSVLRTEKDVKSLQRTNRNATSNSCHCYGTTFDITYTRYDKVTRTRDYMTVDNLKLVLGQVLLNHQRAGKIYVKYEAKQACFHITVRQ